MKSTFLITEVEETTMKKVVIYTAITGSRDILHSLSFWVRTFKKFYHKPDFICFTDKPCSSKTWRIINADLFDTDPCRNAKIYKILPHRFLPDYEYSIWIDGNLRICTDITQLIEQYLADSDYAFFKHPEDRNCIYQEAEACIRLKKDDPELINKQIKFYRDKGYPEKNGLVCCSVILRRNTPNVRKNDEDWWGQIKRFSRRDQLSFPYVAYKNQIGFTLINENIFSKNPYFKKVPHINKSK